MNHILALIRGKRAFPKFFLGGLLIAMTMLAYIPAMRGGFIWDDDLYVTNNSKLMSFNGLQKIWVKPLSTPQYYPIVFTSFWVEYHLWGLKPFGYHFVNVLLHGLNAVLLWLILLRLRVPGAWIGAAIFALHPVHVESVAWITERKNVLSGFFYLSAILVYLRFSLMDNDAPALPPYPDRNSLASSTSHRLGLYLLAVSLYACALLSKTVTCSLPAVILLLLWWKRDRFDWRDVRMLIPLVLLGTVFGTTTVWIEKHYVGAQGEEWALSFVERCLVAGRGLWFYVGKLVWPHKLTFTYPRWQIDSGVWWQYLFPLAAMAVVLSLWFMRKRIGKAPLIAVLFFGGTLVPALGFFDVYPHRFSFVADHFQYLASIGVIVLCFAVMSTLFGQAGPWGRRVEYGLYVALFVILGGLVWHEGHKYKDLETLWRDTIAKNPLSWMAHNNLGNVLQGQGRTAKAIKHFSEALRIYPDIFETHINLGNALLKEGRTDETISHYSEALRIKPENVIAHISFGIALASQGKFNDAITYFNKALHIKPDSAEAHFNLGNALLKQGRKDEAINHYSEALRIQPGHVKVHNKLGLLLAEVEHLSKAIEHFREALRIQPDFEAAQTNLQKALAIQSKIDEAIIQIQGLIQLDPENSALYLKLGNIYKGAGKLHEAEKAYQNALLIQPGFMKASNNLALVYMLRKEYDAALSMFGKIIEVEPDNISVHYNIACAYAKQGKAEESVNWLKKAIDKGFNDWSLLKTDRDFENLKGTAGYEALIQGIERQSLK